ncbi:cytochrome P450 [Mycobacterium montefiorense]|uniref:Cytochrome P450 144 n=1 Tax=Mycobacterium montefiorense TaxID=154654 RepID=A0AA37PJR8_9MYCO|nr:cytochrome P450 [Mycobacterium montefiorense]GBG38853.1 cytochrome P450 144 [Mycobacterium montefiorense]GKU34681.1 cytochrome P450 144 [Mycobacterium montefiorense]GKU38162.1 cytochrome P450 144 [Mycobacterium montefiorense]GKU43450.1 cytochrome P450 144 [Mycobacterium montefiorense]GKU50066.1 cytochrome P450 144 [Mycobacterium montefiorense]
MTVIAHPGTFFGAESLQDPYPLYERMRADGAVHQIGDSEFYAVCGWDAVNDVIARPDDFSSNLTATMTYTTDGGVKAFDMDALGGPTHVLATADDPAHAVHRKLLVRHLAARRIRAIEQFAADTADRLWRQALRDGRIEWMDAMANRLPMMVVAELIGVPAADTAQLMKWGYAATQTVEGLVSEEQLTAAGIAVMELSGYINEQFDLAAADPQDNLLGELAAACASGEVDTVAAQVMMVILFAAGGESTASLLGSAAWILANRPDIQQQLRENPALLPAFIEETLRYEPPFRGHYRHVRNGTVLAGVELPADSHLLLLWGAANRDPAHFKKPGEFLLDRAEVKGHISFGKGAHFCVGAALARLEATIVLRLLLDRTSAIEQADVGRWMPSLLVRRLERLELAVR